MDLSSVVRLDEFSLSKIEQDDRFLDITHAHRLVILIEYEHLAAELSVGSCYEMRTEDPDTSLR